MCCFFFLYPASSPLRLAWSITGTGEQVVAALGELHLEQCLKDLREKHAGCSVRASAPLLSFREGLEPPMKHTDAAEAGGGNGEDDTSDKPGFDWEAPNSGGSGSGGSGGSLFPAQLRTPPWSLDPECGASWALRGGGAARVVSGDGSMAVTIRCRALPTALAHLLDESPPDVVAQALAPWAQSLSSATSTSSSDASGAGAGAGADGTGGGGGSVDGGGLRSLAAFGCPDALARATAPVAALRRALASAANGASGGSGGSSGGERLACLGPRGVGPNLLLVAAPGRLVARAHASAAGICRFAATDPRARRRALPPLLRAIARSATQATAAQAAAGGTISSGEADPTVAAAAAADAAWVTGLPRNDEDGGGEKGPFSVAPCAPQSPLASTAQPFTDASSAATSSSDWGPPSWRRLEGASLCDEAWRRVAQHVCSGFSAASCAGPLCEEPVHGVAFVVEEVDLVCAVAGGGASLMAAAGGGGGGGRGGAGLVLPGGGGLLGSLHAAKAARVACRAALLSSPKTRLVEGHYRCAPRHSLDLEPAQSRAFY